MKAKYDVLIIGAGPAACSAALTLKNRGLTALLTYTTEGALSKAHQVDNYPGMVGMSGAEMLATFRKEVLSQGQDIEKAQVTTILPMGKTFSCLVKNDIISVKGVIFASGIQRAKTLLNESELLGRGVSYCATCDGMLYKKQPMIVISSNAEGVEEANFLSTLSDNVTYLKERAHDTSLLHEKIRVVDSKPLEILGDKKAEGVRTDKGDLLASGIFVFRDAVAPTLLLKGLETKGSAIMHDDKMRTNIPNVFVAGDAGGAPYQIGKAVGEGNIAALSFAEDNKEENNKKEG